LDPMRMPYSGIRSGMTNPEYIVLDAVHREWKRLGFCGHPVEDFHALDSFMPWDLG
jgi:hypothetical protein